MVLIPYVFAGSVTAECKTSTQQAIVEIRYAIRDIFPNDLVEKTDGCFPADQLDLLD